MNMSSELIIACELLEALGITVLPLRPFWGMVRLFLNVCFADALINTYARHELILLVRPYKKLQFSLCVNSLFVGKPSNRRM